MRHLDLREVYGLKWNPFSPDVPVQVLWKSHDLDTFFWRVDRNWSPYRATGTSPLAIEGGLRIDSALRVESRSNLLPFPTRDREGQRNLESGPVVSAMSKPKQTGRDQPTGELLDQARSGDEAARQRLMERFLPLLQRWARGRLPLYARATAETDDLVQVTLLRALQNVARFENRGEGAFLAYLRQILLNAVRDEVRRVGRRPPHDPVDRELPDSSPSAVERVIGRQTMDAYESALAMLEPRQREAVLLRVEFGYSYLQIAESIASPTANGARMTVSRALARMAKEMDA